MNINTLRKNYDKLNSKERFAAIMAASSRDDEQEYKALLQSAPHKSFSLPHTWGLSEAFQFLSNWHVMNQLGCAVTLFFCMFLDKDKDIGDELELIQRCILTEREAWRTICKENGLDADAMLKAYPFIEAIELVEDMVTRINHESPLELPELQETIDTFREVVNRKRKTWE